MKLLSDDEVAEIEALSAKVPDGPWFASADDADDVPNHRRSGLALVDTGRSADWWIARLCEWHIARFIAESKTNVDALCATVRALRSELYVATDLCNVTTESLRRSESENAALREQLAELQRRNDTQYESIMEYQADVKSLQSQLAQVTQEQPLVLEALRELRNSLEGRETDIDAAEKMERIDQMLAGIEDKPND